MTGSGAWEPVPVQSPRISTSWQTGACFSLTHTPPGSTAHPPGQRFFPASSRPPRAVIAPRIILCITRKLMLSRCVSPSPATPRSVQVNCFITPPGRSTSGDGTLSSFAGNPSAPVDGLSTRGPTKLLFRIPSPPASITMRMKSQAGCFSSGRPCRTRKRRKWRTPSGLTGLSSN